MAYNDLVSAAKAMAGEAGKMGIRDVAKAMAEEVDKDRIQVTDKLPEFIDDVSIMTYKQLWDALKFNKRDGEADIVAPLAEFGEHIYYAYTVKAIEADDAHKQALIDLGPDWYKQHYISTGSSEPITVDAKGYQIFGGPLSSVTYDPPQVGIGTFIEFCYAIPTERGVTYASTTDFDKDYYDFNSMSDAELERMHHDINRYVAVVKVEDDSWIQRGLPDLYDNRPSLLTLQELWNTQQDSIKIYGKLKTEDIFNSWSVYRLNTESLDAVDLFNELKKSKSKISNTDFVGGQLIRIVKDDSSLETLNHEYDPRYSKGGFNFEYVHKDRLKASGWGHNVPSDVYVVLQNTQKN